MSADNYFVIRKDDTGRFAATMGFASDHGVPPIDDTDPRFDSLAEALTYANAEYTEYGVRVDVDEQ